MAAPQFDDERHWLSDPQTGEKVYFKDLAWKEMVPGKIWLTEYKGWTMTISSEGRVDVSNPPKNKR